MAIGEADVFKVVVLAARADAFLAGRSLVVIAPLEAEEDVLELVHPGIGEKQRRVVLRDERRTTRCPRSSKKRRNMLRISLPLRFFIFREFIIAEAAPPGERVVVRNPSREACAVCLTSPSVFDTLLRREVVIFTA